MSFTQRFHRTILRIAAVMAVLAPCVATGQESFRATHIALMRTVSSVPSPNRGTGVGIMSVDPVSEELSIRITLVTPGDTVTMVHIRRRTEDGSNPILTSIPYPEGLATVTSSFNIFEPAVYSALDSNLVFLDFRSRLHPDEYMVGELQAAPNAVTFEFGGSEMVPRVDSTNGRGDAYLIYDPAMKAARYFVAWRNLKGAPTSITINRAATGAVGPVVFTIPTPSGTSAATGIWNGISAQDAAAITAGELYMQIGTDSFPQGEIRGQLAPIAVFTAMLEPTNVVPNAPPSTASGTAYMAVSTMPGVGTFIKVRGIAADLSGAIDSVHVRIASPGSNGPLLFAAEHGTGFDAEKDFEVGGLGAATLESICTGGSYVSVRTTQYPNDEIRGQFIPALSSLKVASVAAEGAEVGTVACRFESALDAVSISGAASGRDARAELFDLRGRLLGSAPIVDGHGVVSTAGLPSGLYIVRMCSASATAAARVVIAR